MLEEGEEEDTELVTTDNLDYTAAGPDHSLVVKTGCNLVAEAGMEPGCNWDIPFFIRTPPMEGKIWLCLKLPCRNLQFPLSGSVGNNYFSFHVGVRITNYPN